jgi:hypothetical protein
VFRQPGLHPGDIRVFKARKVPGMEELVGTSGYAIIFSVKGGRSAPDMMAGGNLDGDPYWVCFNKEVGYFPLLALGGGVQFREDGVQAI